MNPLEISDSEILKECKTAKDALLMSLNRSSSNMTAVAIELKMSHVMLSKALHNHYAENLKHEHIIQFMACCGNAIYLRWLYLQIKEHYPNLIKNSCAADSEYLAQEMKCVRDKLDTLLTEIKGKPCSNEIVEGGAMFAFKPKPEDSFPPKWLVVEAIQIDYCLND